MLDLDALSKTFSDTLLAAGRSDRTVARYRYALLGFARFIAPRPVETAVSDDIVAYQRHLGSRHLAGSSVRVASYSLRFLFREVLEHRDWDYGRIPPARLPSRLPDVLDQAEVETILDAAPNLLYRAAFMTVYSSGLRTDECLHLEPRHVDASRGVIRVEHGKGARDRTVTLSPVLLRSLRRCWRAYRPKTYLFEGRIPGRPISPSALQRAFRSTCRRAGIRKRATPRTLRHSFATHLVEGGTPICVVQALLGHRSLATTAIYTHLSKNWHKEVRSPLDSLWRLRDVD